jgi:hypothetical protein
MRQSNAELSPNLDQRIDGNGDAGHPLRTPDAMLPNQVRQL